MEGKREERDGFRRVQRYNRRTDCTKKVAQKEVNARKGGESHEKNQEQKRGWAKG